MTHSDHAVIIGAGHAGGQLAISLRRHGREGNVTLIGQEPVLPYHRPPLSKTGLGGSPDVENLLIRKPEYYRKSDINFRLDCAVKEIDRDSRQIELQDGSRLSYTQLAIATGASVRKLVVSGAGLAGVCYLRNLEDVELIRKHVAPGGSAVVIGGGYIGLETAASLNKLGMRVTVLEALPRVLQRVTAPEVSAFYKRVHEEEGVDIRTGVTVHKLEGETHVEGVILDDGSRCAANLVVIGIGVLPETKLAETAGLEVCNGIVVDEYARTSDEYIVACGDCANHYNPIYGRRLRLESVQNASEQAIVAAKTLCGKFDPYHAVPWFWSDQYNLKLQIAGLSQDYDRAVVRGSPEIGRSFAVFYFAGERLLAVDAINRPREFSLARKALVAGQIVDPDVIINDSADLQTAFK